PPRRSVETRPAACPASASARTRPSVAMFLQTCPCCTPLARFECDRTGVRAATLSALFQAAGHPVHPAPIHIGLLHNVARKMRVGRIRPELHLDAVVAQ